MRKFYLILASCLALAGNVKAENFVEALGAECGRILFNMKEYTYPDRYPNIVKRNTQFDAVEKCVELYKQNGGDVKELNTRYYQAVEIANCEYNKCEKEISASSSVAKTCFDRIASVFNDAIRQDTCGAYWFYKDEFSNCAIINVLKSICETTLEENKAIDK